MATCKQGTTSVPLESAIGDLVSREDLTIDQKVRAIRDAVRECNELRIIELLEQLNFHMALMTDVDMED